MMFFAVPQAETGSYDFSNDITSVTVERQQGGQWTQSDTFTDGDTIRITDGPMEGFAGIVKELDVEKDKVKVVVSMFGRETPVELELDQVQLDD